MSTTHHAIPSLALVAGILHLGLLSALSESSEGASQVSNASLRGIGMLPEDKKMEQVDGSSRNVFGMRNNDSERPTAQSQFANSEEQQVMELLGRLPITGKSEGPSGKRLLMGDIILEEGSLVPQLLPEQTKQLRVSAIGGDRVDLEWVRDDGKRTTGFALAYDLGPRVNILLKGRLDEEGKRASDVMGTLDEEQIQQQRTEPGSQITNVDGLPRSIR
ncbi:MAG: hypothetical protein AAF555_02245 [Verrucomicrobiota bacterium]